MRVVIINMLTGKDNTLYVTSRNEYNSKDQYTLYRKGCKHEISFNLLFIKSYDITIDFITFATNGLENARAGY